MKINPQSKKITGVFKNMNHSILQKQNPIVILGGGMAGLIAGTYIQQQGEKSIIIEKSSKTGGSMKMSGGSIWCFKNHSDYKKINPHGNTMLGEKLIDNFLPSIEWLISLGAPIKNVTAALYRETDRHCYQMTPNSEYFTQFITEKFLELGGEIIFNSNITQIKCNSNKLIEEIEIKTNSQIKSINCSSLILATGGFHNNPTLKNEHFGKWSDKLIVRGNLYSTGDGLKLATSLGAKKSKSMDSFYGHLMPAPPAEVPRNRFSEFTMYHSEHCLLLNEDGNRFTDESICDESNAEATIQQNNAISYMIFDDKIYKKYGIKKSISGEIINDPFKKSIEINALTTKENSIQKLVETLSYWGVKKEASLKNILGYNDYLINKNTSSISIPRAKNFNPIGTPPYYAIALTTGITLTLGGLETNENAQVLNDKNIPIGNLYSIGGDSGGIYNHSYGGGLCLGLVFGKIAAGNAIKYHH
tara:strand:+ start:5668 stop:7086 length:1419 start_codon:yes stop_codon:yes gene_type:complete